ncbi:unnamed protein product [Adineta ricciae]|uniref:Uncharacterized protein n=1 Tax=Adineta ricciae TaxID=249248 RepID=A0A813PPK4_ADIRI|nr:unnamed protein product [Adineta ricciae]CAF1637590.1 unnamed protein product [Adineta ricciae]
MTTHLGNKSIHSFDIDTEIERLAVQELVTKRAHRQHLLASDVYCLTAKYRPLRPLPRITIQHSTSSNSQMQAKSVRTIADRQASFYCSSCHQNLTSTRYQPSTIPSAQQDYHLQLNYELYYSQKPYLKRRFNYKQRWKIYGMIFIFYFMLKRKLRIAKKNANYYEYDYHRIRFLELLTVVHRVYLDPNCSIYQTLSHVVRNSTQLLDQTILFHCVQVILDQITNLIPKDGLIGTSSRESVFIYLLDCSLEQYPTGYFWSIEKHLLSLSYAKMRERGFKQLDHFTTKFLVISVFIYRGLIKTLLLKPVKYRLIRGQLNRTQWLNIRLLSSVILYITRHAIIYKEQNNQLPMPFPIEMKNYLMDDAKLKNIFKTIDQLVESTAPELSSWASEYADRLQRYLVSMKAY